MDLIITILPVVTKDLPISPRFTPYNFLSRCKFGTLTTRQPMVEFYLLTFPRFPLRKKEHKSYIGKNRTHDFCTSHRYAIAWPDKLGTDPMAYGGFIMDAAAELGRNPVSKHQIQPEYGDEQADAGRDGWTRLARPNSQARTGTGEYSFSLFSWPRAGLATLPGWSILCYMWWPYIHTY